MQHPDEGTIHAWLDGALAPAEAKRIEEHVASCESCGAAVAEARGLIAAASRILTALDDVPAGVIPMGEGGASGTSGTGDQLAALRARRAAAERRPSRWARPGVVAAAAIVFVAAGTMLVVQRGRVGVTAMNDRGDRAAQIGTPASPTSRPPESPTTRPTESATPNRLATTGAEARDQALRKDQGAGSAPRMDSSAAGPRRFAESKPAPPEVPAPPGAPGSVARARGADVAPKIAAQMADARQEAGNRIAAESGRALSSKKAVSSALNAGRPDSQSAVTDSLARFRRDQGANAPVGQVAPTAAGERLGFARSAPEPVRGGADRRRPPRASRFIRRMLRNHADG